MEDTRLRDWLEPPEQRSPNWFQQRGRAFERILNAMLFKEEMEPRTSMRARILPQSTAVDSYGDF